MKLIDYFKGYMRSQFTDMSGVTPTVTWHKNRFFLNSPAGVIIYRPENDKDISRFRNTWVNQFKMAEKDKESLFALYRSMKRSEKVSYKANLNTRWKSLLYAI